MANNTLANKGRYGDTKIRPVGGRKAHVNPLEALLIDLYGKKGEQATKRMGAGTINPRTGLPEYHKKWWQGHPAHHWSLQSNPIADALTQVGQGIEAGADYLVGGGLAGDIDEGVDYVFGGGLSEDIGGVVDEYVPSQVQEAVDDTYIFGGGLSGDINTTLDTGFEWLSDPELQEQTWKDAYGYFVGGGLDKDLKKAYEYTFEGGLEDSLWGKDTKLGNWLYKVQKGASGFSPNYIGKYKGKDEELGWGSTGLQSIEEGRKALTSLTEGYEGDVTGGYGIGEAMKAAGIDYGFDVTDEESFGKALAMQEFEKEVSDVFDLEKPYEHELFQEFSSPSEIKKFGEFYGPDPYAAIDLEGYFEKWMGERGEDYQTIASEYATNPYELSKLGGGHVMYRQMENPEMQTVSDIYREDVATTQNIGDIVTGSSAEKRKKYLEQLTAGIAGIRQKSAGVRSGLQESLIERLISAFNQ